MTGKSNYLFLINNTSPNIGDQGWSDGYNDLIPDTDEIIRQLYKKISNDKLVEYLSIYLQGYESGKSVSDNIEEVYDEDGDVVDGWEIPDPLFDHMNEAKVLLGNYIKKLETMKTIDEINDDILKLRKNDKSVNEISDGYHTIGDYKEMRNLYFIALCNAYPEISWKSKKHFDEENDPISEFDGDFIAGINTPKGTISRHLKLKYWDDLCIKELENAPEYDGYTEEDMKIRIKSLNRNNE